MPDLAREKLILAMVRAVPEGYVTTYGDLCPEAPRLPGRILSDSADDSLPWHRVVRADGSLSKGDRQRKLLDREGVPFAGPRVEMDVARLPREALADLL
jgi:alkylated DNA nucleotide flippase Atl1